MDTVTMEQITEIRDLEYWSNATLCSDILNDWKKIKPNNKETLAMLKALGEMHFYTARLRDDVNKRDKYITKVQNQRLEWMQKCSHLERDLKMALQ
tara:strand:- start:124 stop:411 length:288 start_codon:yes stop_codon:yes gene_type:complete